ncbi:MAG: DUF4139 domain-containing protein [Planctomycetes bacterium]|nr:DUF4139 domain-containing protein [Planctomycetota bacterium]MCL4729790.1 mucoidy inhibitor MuiA family protein [Planctomycetota bacterium]
MSNPKPAVDSKAVAVTFFEDRAEVTRRAGASVGEGRHWVRVAGSTVYLDDRSVQARVARGGAKVLAARVQRQLRHIPRESDARLEELRRRLEELQAREQQLSRDQNRTGHRRAQLDGMLQNVIAGLANVPDFSKVTPEAWQAALDALIKEDEQEFERGLTLESELDDLRRQQGEARTRLQLGSQTNRLFECFVEVQLESAGPDDVELEIVYRTPCALWRPEHLATLNVDPRNAAAGQVVLTTWGTVWQRTGEDWKDIEVCFSTARPAQVAEPPLLNDDVLARRKKTPEERKKVVVEMREQTVADTGGARQAPQMPGVDDGGVPLEFRPKGHFDIPGNGQPARVEIGTTTMAATVSRVLMPERTPLVHLKARATWPGPHPLLAGPLRVARGASLVGRARTGFVGAGESFDLGFGADDGLRCKRGVHEEREQAALTGTQTIRRTVTLYLSNLAGEARAAELTERVPVSEIEGLEVKLVETQGWQPDGKDGYLRRQISVAPRANETLTFKYEIRAAKHVQLPF